MDLHLMDFPAWLAPYQPLVPLQALVEETNRIYHSFDAGNYDTDHLEIRLLWPELWAEMMRHLPARERWRVLDFGCGTGFETEQLFNTLGSKIEFLMAYDLSGEMLSQAKRRLGGNSRIHFDDDFSAVGRNGTYNLLVTNSVLHHLPDFEETLSSLLPLLSADACWLSGNEPSARFYRNPECIDLTQKYSEYRERLKWFEPGRYRDKLRKISRRHTLRATARRTVERGLFAIRPSDTVIARLVDFHVPHPLDDPGAGRGLDLEKMGFAFKEQWTLLWSKTYSYLGQFSELRAPKRWLEKARLLKERFPSDGANFCAVWSRQVHNLMS